MPDETFPLRNNLYIALVFLLEGQPPQFCLVPRLAWERKHAYLVHHDYVGRKSSPECGINLSKTAFPSLLRDFALDILVAQLR